MTDDIIHYFLVYFPHWEYAMILPDFVLYDLDDTNYEILKIYNSGDEVLQSFPDIPL